MLTADGVERIVELGSSEVQEIGGYNYLKTSKGANLILPPSVETVECFSITQVISLLKAHELSAGEGAAEICINPISHSKVLAFISELDPVNRYEKVAITDFSKVLEDFPDGQQFGQEEMIIKLLTMFDFSEERQQLLQLIQKVSAGRITEGEDDGVSQTVSTKAGVHLLSQAKVKNPWMLKPFRSFPEIKPIEVPFILRVHQRGDALPSFSLNECDGGAWKVATTLAVRKWLQDEVMKVELKKVTVL
jgi:hypothetical protein